MKQITVRKIKPKVNKKCRKSGVGSKNQPIMSEKLQKVLARKGMASRRKFETWISEGRIQVNGMIAKIGARVSFFDLILVDGKPFDFGVKAKKIRLIAYHKPNGQICTLSDPEARKTVFSSLPRLPQGRWIMVGRLDINTSGLMFFTNDGDLANRLMHPSSGYVKEYAVRVFGQVTESILKRLVTGISLRDGIAHFEKILYLGGTGLNHWYQVTITEGRNRLVRRLWESQGLRVSRLKRVGFGNFFLKATLTPGHYQELDPSIFF